MPGFRVEVAYSPASLPTSHGKQRGVGFSSQAAHAPHMGFSSNDQELSMANDARDASEGCELHRRRTAKPIGIVE